jgi:hypothetical protein
MAQTKATRRVSTGGSLVHGGRVRQATTDAPWLTGRHMVRYYAGGWSVEDLAAIQRELERQGVAFTMDGDDLLVDHDVERMVDMIVESITET